MKKIYKLMDKEGNSYESENPGLLGGNKKLKIYGTLDCGSANRWIEKGKYVENRVFFENKETAIMAGYRPCAICMRDDYEKWKTGKLLFYTDYNSININEEAEKIKKAEETYIYLNPNNKNCLFILGMLFAKSIKIKILNEKELDLKETGKSFTLMPYVWSKLVDDNFPNKDYSNVLTTIDERIENIKRIGVNFPSFLNVLEEEKIFLICPVRNATPEQKKWIENFFKEKYEEGYLVHAPHLHTIQTDLFGGFAICTQNATALASSSEVDIYYDQNSMGSVFDLGVAYLLEKTLVLLNEDKITIRDDDIIDNIIVNWPYKKEKNKLLTKAKIQ